MNTKANEKIAELEQLIKSEAEKIAAIQQDIQLKGLQLGIRRTYSHRIEIIGSDSIKL